MILIKLEFSAWFCCLLAASRCVYVDLSSLSDLGKGEKQFHRWGHPCGGVWYPQSWNGDDDECQQRDLHPSRWLQPTERSLVLLTFSRFYL